VGDLARHQKVEPKRHGMRTAEAKPMMAAHVSTTFSPHNNCVTVRVLVLSEMGGHWNVLVLNNCAARPSGGRLKRAININ